MGGAGARRAGWPAFRGRLLAMPGALLFGATLHATPSVAQRPDSVVPLPALLVSTFALPMSLAGAPAAISVVDGGRAMRARPGIGLGGLLDRVPGVQVDDRHNDALDERIAIRGFGARSQFGVRGLSVIVDGVPATMPDGQTALSHLDPSAIRRAEILRGPASTFVGNAGGGALRIETVPDVDGVAGRALGGADGLLRLEAEAAGRVAGARVSGRLARRRDDGYREHSDADKTWAAGHAELGAGPGRLRIDLHGVTYEARNPGSLSDSARLADPRAAFPRNVEQATGEDATQAQTGAGWTGTLAGGGWEAGVWLLHRDVDNPIPVAIVDLTRTAAGLRLRHHRRAGRVSWAAGVDLGEQRDRRRNFANDGGSRGETLLDQRERVRALAPLAHAVAELGRVSLSAAARWDVVRFAVRDFLRAPDAPDPTGRRTLSALSPSVGLAWRPRRGLTLFGNLSSAFETPTTSEFANDPEGGGFNADLDPQRTRGAEAGARGVWGALEGVRWELVGHHARVTDALVPFEGMEGRTFFRNAGRTRHAGLEAALAAEVTRAVSARAAWSWTRVVFREFAVEGADLRGRAVPGVTPHRVEVAVAARGAGGYAEIELRHRSRTAADDANTAFWPAHTVANARVEAPAARLGETLLRAHAGVLNLADRSYVGAIVPNAFGARYYEPGPGRTWYVGVALEGVEPVATRFRPTRPSGSSP